MLHLLKQLSFSNHGLDSSYYVRYTIIIIAMWKDGPVQRA